MASFRLLSQGRFAALFGGTRQQRLALTKLLPGTRGEIEWWDRPPKSRDSLVCHAYELPRLGSVADTLEELAGFRARVVPGVRLDITVDDEVLHG